MAQNQFLPFAIGVGANVEDQATWAADPVVTVGFSPGIALSNKLNKAWRQGTVTAAMIGQFIVDNAVVDALDDGNVEALQDNFELALLDYLVNVVGFRKPITTPTTFVVNADPAIGNDASGDGSVAAPWLTLQHAVNKIGTFDTGNNAITLNSTGAFTAPTLIANVPSTIIFNFTNGSSVTVGSGDAFFMSGASNVTIQGGVTIAATGAGAFGIEVQGASFTIGNGVIFDFCTSAHIAVAKNGTLTGFDVNYSIMQNSVCHLLLLTHCVVQFGGVQVTHGAGITYSNAFLVAGSGADASINSANCSFLGSVPTGKKFSIATRAGIDTNGGGPSFLPGSLAGTVDATTYATYL